MEELKPCPFCGGEAVERCFDGYDAIQCDNCGQVIILPQHGCGKEHIAAFNRRTDPMAPSPRSANALEKLILDIEDRMTLDVRERVVLHDAVTALRRAAPENKGCADCSGIVYRQTSSGKIIPADQRCGAKITPPCYQPDGDGCAYQIYGDNNDEPIDRCKACPLCYSDKVRHIAPENKALTLDELRQMDGEPVFVASPGAEEYGHWVIVAGVDDSDGDKTLYCNGDFTCRDYGKTWLAYTRRPEGSDSNGFRAQSD